MATWKELGMVPDSEEEDEIDSQELGDDLGFQQNRANAAISKTSLGQQSPTTVPDEDIWDVPASPPALGKPKTLFRVEIPAASAPRLAESTQSSPLTSIASDHDLSDAESFLLADDGEEENHDSTTADLVEDKSPDANFRQQDGAPSSLPRHTQSQASQRRPLQSQVLGDPPSLPKERARQDLEDPFKSSSPADAASPRQASIPQPIVLPDPELEQQTARQTAIRFERSLRPRKPIQEHPYLLENAHYSTILRDHGVRPVRALIEAERERKRKEGTAQDQEFRDDSQESQFLWQLQQSQISDLEPALALPPGPESSSPLRTPPSHRARQSSPTSSRNDTDDTSVFGQDLPDLAALLDAKRNASSHRQSSKSKRFRSSAQSTARKRRRMDVVDSDPVEPQALRTQNEHSRHPYGDFLLASQPDDEPVNQGNSARLRIPSPIEMRHHHDSIFEDSAMPGSDHELSGAEPALENEVNEAVETSTASEAESEPRQDDSAVVNKVGKRIRGVLPASWLRLDQQVGRDRVEKSTRRPLMQRSPNREQRKGVAQRRIGSSSAAVRAFAFDSSDEEEPTIIPSPTKTTDEVFYNQTRLEIEPIELDSAIENIDSGDDGSVVEDDSVDRMASGPKRQTKLHSALRKQKGQKHLHYDQFTASRKAIKIPKQPRITDHLSRTASGSRTSSSKRPSKSKAQSRPKQSKSAPRQRTSRTSPPRIGILDVIPPDAPRFLRLAARAAKRQPNQGRSSPSKKAIRLATRQDHVDATSVLNEWRSGSIRPRQSVSAAVRVSSKPQNPLPRNRDSQLHPPTSHSAPRTAPRALPRKLVKQTSAGGTVSFKMAKAGTDAAKRPPPKSSSHVQQASLARPAQLEIESTKRRDRNAFYANKKFLDRLYQQNQRQWGPSTSHAASEVALEDHIQHLPPTNANFEGHQPAAKPSEKQFARPRLRKRRIPRRLDVEAPHYSHAADPVQVAYPIIPEPVLAPSEGSKLLGLGPYGTQYTHHFDLFPLDGHVFFHNSTPLGSGILKTVTDNGLTDCMYEPRQRVSYHLGDQTLRWGPWDAQVSSELGILLDFAGDQLEGASSTDSRDIRASVNAVSFVLSFFRSALHFQSKDDVKGFIARVCEVMQGFNERFGRLLIRPSSESPAEHVPLFEICDSLLMNVFVAFRLSHQEASLLKEQIQVEELLKSIARTIMATLVVTGTPELRKTYEQLNQVAVVDRGLRVNSPVIHSWVVLIRVLEHAAVLRASFWDLLSDVLKLPDIGSNVNAQQLESIWEVMFSVLPLTEFSDEGIVLPNRRHVANHDGWTIPQKLLRRVFQLYEGNQHQSPSFNNYCRALVGRCHYLVQQWGWRKSVTVIGVIFDFFGKQNLEHLRNEEVYASPRFLDRLADQPTLDIEPQDRCFHVFLKLVALSIRRLRDNSSTKDIRNLVSRTMPNHDRQLLKEQTIQERHLAALRNHHDLLCTLYWASPPDLRPPPSRIESLVAPASSHKEACLINLRAWNQLARFVVASGEAATNFKHFRSWRDRFFEQMMQQYDSVAADIQQQFKALSKDVSQSISPDMINGMISMNKSAVMDVLQLSMAASLDVMRHTPDLEAAAFALNLRQLAQIFKHFSAAPPEMEWSMLNTAMSTLETFLARIDTFKENEESQQTESQILNSAQADDAIQALDSQVASSFFSMARCLLKGRRSKARSAVEHLNRDRCAEQAVVLAARIGIRFMDGGLHDISDMFKYGKYCLFEGDLHQLSLVQRKHLPLFVLSLLQRGFDSFHHANFTLDEVWALSVVKPREALSYEIQLGQELSKRQVTLVPEGLVGLAISPDYGTNRGFFEYVLSSMRKSLAQVGPSVKKMLVTEHTKTLKLVMDQIKGDLRALVNDSASHHSYVVFVREIISLIKSHGPDNCAVDDFFYQISKEYSPSTQDPQLQVATMISYGVRLGDDDSRAAHQLFYFLFNHFKLSLNNDQLDDDVLLLVKGLRDPNIFAFVVGKMFPAIVQASFKEPSAFPLMDVWVKALRLFMSCSAATYVLDQSGLALLGALYESVSLGMSGMTEGQHMTDQQIHVLKQVVSLLNAWWPSILQLSLSEPSGQAWFDLSACLERLLSWKVYAGKYLSDQQRHEHVEINISDFLAPLHGDDLQRGGKNQLVQTFADNIIDDIRRNWAVSGNRIMTQAPGKGRTTFSTQTQTVVGVLEPTWNIRDLTIGLKSELEAWIRGYAGAFGEMGVDSKDAHPVICIF